MRICENCKNEHDGSYGSGRFCSKKCAKSFSTKLKRNDINLKVSKTIKEKIKNGETIGFIKPNKDLDNGYYTKICSNCSKEYKTRKKSQKYCSSNCTHTSEEYRKQISKKNKGVTGGLRKGSGRGKSGWYKGIWCDSSYELAWVIYNLEHDILFERNHKSYKYIYNDEEHKYFPDFICDKKLIEIKGFIRDNDKSKFKSEFDMDLKILYKKDIQKELNYTIQKYGKDYIKLYENNPHNQKLNKCMICGEPSKNTYCSRKCAGVGVGKKLNGRFV